MEIYSCYDTDMEKVAKSWSAAMRFSKERMQKVWNLHESEMDAAVQDGRLVLETVCLFVHSSIKSGQFR